MTGYDVAIEGLPMQAVIDLKGEAAALADWCGEVLPPFPARPNSLTRASGRALLHIGPGHWLLCADLADEDGLIAALRPDAAPPQVSVVPVSDSLAHFAVTGPDAAEVMAVASPLDLHPTAFAEDAASFTEAFGIRALVRRHPGGFVLSVDRSFAPMILQALTLSAS